MLVPQESFLVPLLLAAGARVGSSATFSEQFLSSGTVQLGEWAPAYAKASSAVAALSTAEKLSLITGGSAGNLSALTMFDSATCPRSYAFVTTWPAGLAMSMTWDRDAMDGQGLAMGAEFRGKGINVALGPTLEPLGRSAWAGRVGEAYGVDSYLAGTMGGALVSGMADAGVITVAKHFILNEQETNRLGNLSAADLQEVVDESTFTAYDVMVDDKAFHETYLAPFYDTVRAGMGGAMCAMNRVNGTYACENQDLLARYLKVELGFPGFVKGDVDAQKTGVGSANAGLDFGSTSYWNEETLGAGLDDGSFTEERLDDMAIRNLMGYYRYAQDDGSFPSAVGALDDVDVRANHSTLARTYAAESIALLKNVDRALPFKNRRTVSIFGYHAAPRYFGANIALSVYSGETATFPGHMAGVGGSAMGSFAYLSTPIQVFSERAARDGFMLRWWLNDTAVTEAPYIAWPNSGTELTESTLGVADGADACVVFLNAWAGEGSDRPELRSTEQDTLVTTVASACNNTVVVINTIGPRLLDAWIDHDNITAVLYAGALGQESGNAIDDVLFGAVNPSGRLVHTIAHNESDYDPVTQVSDSELELSFTDGNYIDYKSFDARNVTPRFEFGFGLSYTTFVYAADLSVDTNTSALAQEYATGTRAVGGRDDLWDVVANVTTSISNTGAVAGKEVAQLYIEFPETAGEPARQLRGFQKVLMQPGQSAEATFELRRRDLSVWDVAAQEWKVERGTYTLYIGASSRDLKSWAIITVS